MATNHINTYLHTLSLHVALPIEIIFPSAAIISDPFVPDALVVEAEDSEDPGLLDRLVGVDGYEGAGRIVVVRRFPHQEVHDRATDDPASREVSRCDADIEIGRASCREECVSTCRSGWSPDN